MYIKIFHQILFLCILLHPVLFLCSRVFHPVVHSHTCLFSWQSLSCLLTWLGLQKIRSVGCTGIDSGKRPSITHCASTTEEIYRFFQKRPTAPWENCWQGKLLGQCFTPFLQGTHLAGQILNCALNLSNCRSWMKIQFSLWPQRDQNWTSAVFQWASGCLYLQVTLNLICWKHQSHWRELQHLFFLSSLEVQIVSKWTEAGPLISTVDYSPAEE